MSTDATAYAHEGGDTAPGTREQIAKRNKEADQLAQAEREAAERIVQATEEHRQTVADTTGSLVVNRDDEKDPLAHMGGPVPPAEEPAAHQAARASRAPARQQQQQRKSE
jgi:hypothetical protein